MTVNRLLAAADLELRARLKVYDDVLDAGRAALTDTQHTQTELHAKITNGGARCS